MDSRAFQVGMRSPLGFWAIAFAVVWLVGAGGIYGFFQSKIRSLDTQNKAYAQKIRETQDFMSNLPDVDAAIKQNEDLIKNLEQKMLKPGEHERVVTAVAEAAKAKGIFMTGMKPVFADRKEKARVEGKRLLPDYFQLGMQGRYSQIGEFFEQLETLPLFLSIAEFQLQSDPLKPGLLKADITLVAYEEGGA